MKLIPILNRVIVERQDDNNIYYHGSPHKFDNLKKDVGKKTGGDEYGWGIYLTADKNLAIHYARQGYVYNIKIPNNLVFLHDDKKVSKSNLDKIRKMFIDNDDIVDHRNNAMTSEHKLFIINNIIKDSKNGLDLYNKILRIFSISDKTLSEMLDGVGINGMIGNDGKETVIFNETNIKIISIDSLT